MALLSILELDLLDGRVDDENPGVVLLRVGRDEVEAPVVRRVLLGEAPDPLAVLELHDRSLALAPRDGETLCAVDLAPGGAVVLHVEQSLEVLDLDGGRDASAFAGKEVEALAVRPEILRVTTQG